MKSTFLHILSIIGTVLGLIIEGGIIMDISSTAKIIDKKVTIKGKSVPIIKYVFCVIILLAIAANAWGIRECSRHDKCNIDSCNKDTSSANNKSISDWLSIVALGISLIGLLCTLLLIVVPELKKIKLLHIISITTLSIGFGATLICFLYCVGGECDTTI